MQMPTPDWLPLTSWNMRKTGPPPERTSASSLFKPYCNRRLDFLFYRNPFCEQYLTQAIFKRQSNMRTRFSGNNKSSVSGKRGSGFGFSAASATKFGCSDLNIEMLTRSWSRPPLNRQDFEDKMRAGFWDIPKSCFKSRPSFNYLCLRDTFRNRHLPQMIKNVYGQFICIRRIGATTFEDIRHI